MLSLRRERRYFVRSVGGAITEIRREEVEVKLELLTRGRDLASILGMGTMNITSQNENLIYFYLREVGDRLTEQSDAEELWRRLDEAWPRTMTTPWSPFESAPSTEIALRTQLAAELPAMAARVGLELPGRVLFNRAAGGLGLGDNRVYVLTDTGYEPEDRSDRAASEITDAP